MSDFNENITRLYQSYPETEFRYHTIEFYHPAIGFEYYYKTSNPVTKDFRLGPDDPIDPNVVKTFQPSNFRIQEPGQEPNTNSILLLDFDIQALDGVNAIIDKLEADTTQFQIPIRLIYRIYHNQDTNIGQSQKETVVYMSQATLNPSNGIRMTFTTTNNATVRTGDVYSITDFPGLVSND